MHGSDTGVNRRDFLFRGLTRAIERAGRALGEQIAPATYVRPPGALPEAALAAACTRCGACATACPTHVIVMLGADAGITTGTPVLDLAMSACAMCADMPCATACPTGALAVPERGWAAVRLAELHVDRARCITYRDVECGVCARACPVGAAALVIDERGHPAIGTACTGCGTCIAACVTAPSSLSAQPTGGH